MIANHMMHFFGFQGQRLNLLEYHVPKRRECLADLFRVLEDNKTLLNIEHYSVNQTTLEQVQYFEGVTRLHFAMFWRPNPANLQISQIISGGHHFFDHHLCQILLNADKHVSIRFGYCLLSTQGTYSTGPQFDNYIGHSVGNSCLGTLPLPLTHLQVMEGTPL